MNGINLYFKYVIMGSRVLWVTFFGRSQAEMNLTFSAVNLKRWFFYKFLGSLSEKCQEEFKEKVLDANF